MVKFVTALAHYICLSLPAVFTQPGDHLLAEPCRAKVEEKTESLLLREVYPVIDR